MLYLKKGNIGRVFVASHLYIVEKHAIS